MKPIKTIFFDYDRTLRLSNPLWENFAINLVEEIGFSPSLDQKKAVKRWVYYYFQSNEFTLSYEKLPESDFWNQFYVQFLSFLLPHATQAQQYAAHVQDLVLNECFPAYREFIPESARRCLQKLSAGGYQLGIITNRSLPIAEELAAMNLAHFFPCVVVSGQVGFKKPQPEIFHHALQITNAEASSTLYVGDNYFSDVLGAKNAGISAILIDPEGLFPEADCPVIGSVSELPLLLSQASA